MFDFGLDADSGRHYIVMEYVEGRSGAELLREEGHLPVSDTLAILGHACRGLEFAHRNGVVHRDIKPGNLLRSKEGTTKVADFGIAKNLADESSITQVGSVLGTASYLAPEQASGDEAGPPADLYGLGVVAYQLLSGQLPEANSLTELAMKQQRGAPPLLDEIVEGVRRNRAGGRPRAGARPARPLRGRGDDAQGTERRRPRLRRLADQHDPRCPGRRRRAPRACRDDRAPPPPAAPEPPVVAAALAAARPGAGAPPTAAR